MDVRCEKCLTVYDFDESQVTPQGVTVKCTQCGNLFKVKRKDTVETPIIAPAAPSHTTQPTQPARPQRTAPHAPAPLPPAMGPLPTPPAPAPSRFVVRTALSGEVFRLDDLSQLKQWILDRKLTRDDLISTDGASFVRLGAVPEAEPIFAQVDAWRAQEVPPELATTAPMGRPELGPTGPLTLGDTSIIDDATGPTAPKPRLTPAQLSLPPVVDDLADLDVPARARRWPLVVTFLLMVLAGGGYVWHERPALWKRLTGAVSGGGRGQKALAEGRDKQALDTDDGFRQAQAAFLEAHGADGDDWKPLAALAETDATWAWYLRDDARVLDAQGPQASAVAQTLRKEAQGHVDDAKRYAQDALALDAEALEVNRAMADFLRVDGAPAAEAERYLKRALDQRPDDAEAVYVAGALALREGKLDDARVKLDQSLQLSRAAGRPLLRALYLDAKVAMAQSRPADARALLDELLKVNPSHDRAKALLASVQSAPQALAPDAGSAPVASPSPAAPSAQNAIASPSPTPPAAASPAPSPRPQAAQPAEEKLPKSYNELVTRADKLSESGRTAEARKLYEKALESNPRGAEALTGLGYCDLDKEKFLSAVDRFRQALDVAPDYGDALIGIAESYKIQGQKSRALEYYKRYLKAQPHGAKAQMAEKNVREIEQQTHATSQGSEEPAKPKTEDNGESTALPHLPKPPSGDDQPPPP